jgi:hypothetical protein
MTSLTMVTTRTSKTAGEGGPDAMLHSGSPPSYGYDLNTVKEQNNMLAIRDQLNATSVFKVPDYGTSLINSDGLLVLTLTYIVADMSTVPGLTTDNAYELCVSTKLTEATALNIGEYQDWKTKYFAEHFTVSNVVTTSEPA